MVRRQFLTPPSLPATSVSRCLVIPDSKEWLGIFNSVLLETAQAFNYEQVNLTDMTPEDVAALCYDIYQTYLMGACGMDCGSLLACLYPVGRLQRMNPATGRYEVSDDGGTTWQDASDQDPRFVAPRNVQAATFDCDDVKAIVGYIQNMVDDLKDNIDLGYTVLGIVAALVSVLAIVFSFGAAAPVAIAFAGALTGITSAAITAALTNAVWERLLLNIYCIISAGSEVTTAQFDAILAQLAVDETGLAYTVLWHAINQLGPVGLQNAVALNTPVTGVTGDCDCFPGWCYEFTWSAGNEGWTIVAGTNNAGQMTQVASGGNRLLTLQRLFSDVHITTIRVFGDRTVAAGGGSSFLRYKLNGGANTDVGLPTAAGPFTTDISVNATIDEVAIFLHTAGTGSLSWLESVTFISDVGDNPFGADNC